MTRRKVDLPEPEWWSEARALFAEGLTRTEIARRLGKGYSTVRVAVSPEYREAENARRVRYRSNTKPSPKRDLLERKRYRLRFVARKLWRDDGKTRPLESYYQELHCL